MIFSVVTEMCNRYYNLIFRIFSAPHRKPHPSQQPFPRTRGTVLEWSFPILFFPQALWFLVCSFCHCLCCVSRNAGTSQAFALITKSVLSKITITFSLPNQSNAFLSLSYFPLVWHLHYWPLFFWWHSCLPGLLWSLSLIISSCLVVLSQSTHLVHLV